MKQTDLNTIAFDASFTSDCDGVLMGQMFSIHVEMDFESTINR